MNREEFMAKLKALLGDIPAEEREEALQYYEDYFDDAGADNEAEVIRELEMKCYNKVVTEVANKI